MTGQLFTHYFLTDGIKATAEWPASAAVLRRLPAQPRRRLPRLRPVPATQRGRHRAGPHPAGPRPPRLDRLPAAARVADRNEDIPDHLLFTDAESKTQRRRPAQPESARCTGPPRSWRRANGSAFPWTPRDSDDRVQASTPHGQLLRYLSSADIDSDGNGFAGAS